jgi:hypothetical protein
VRSYRKAITVLFALLLLPALLSASKIVDHRVDVSNGRVDVLLTLDAPYKEGLKKSQEKGRIVVALDGARVVSEKVEAVGSPLLSKLTLSPAGQGTKVIVEVPGSVTMKAGKSPDGLRVRLRFEKPAASRAAVLASAAAAAPSAQSAMASPKAGFLDRYPPTYYLTVLFLTLLLLLLLWRRRRKREARTASFARARFFIAAKKKINAIVPRLVKKSKLLERAKPESSTAAPSRLQRFLNPRSKLVLTATGLLAIMLLLPKVNLYYQLEHEVKPYGVILSGERLDDKGLWLNIDDATLYIKQIESAHAQSIEILLLGLYNRIDIKKIALSSTFDSFVPTDVERIRILYSVLDPLHVTVDAAGDFGTAQAKASLTERTISVTLQPSKLMKTRFRSTLNRLKKDETGGYRYESRF